MLNVKVLVLNVHELVTIIKIVMKVTIYIEPILHNSENNMNIKICR